MSKYTTDIFIQKLDIKRILGRLFQFYKLYIFIAIFSLSIAYYINTTSPYIYHNSSTILLKEADNSQTLLSSRDFLSNVGFLNNAFSIDTKIELLRSFQLINETIDKLNFEVSYFQDRSVAPLGLMKNASIFTVTDELYDKSPIKVIFNHAHSQPVYYNFRVKILSKEEYQLIVTGSLSPMYNYIDDEVTGYVGEPFYNEKKKFDEEVITDNFRFTVTLNQDWDNSLKNKEVHFQFNNMVFLTYEFMNSFSVEQTSQLSSLLRLSVKGQNFNKITDFLNQYIFTLLNDDLQSKNEIASSTIGFIDSQISTISDSLSSAESNLRSFRSSHQVTDLSYQGQKIYEQMSSIEQEKASLLLQKRYYDNLYQYINSSTSNRNAPVAPSSMNIVDPVLSSLISQLTNLNSQLNEAGAGDRNIFKAELEKQATSIKQTIRENINSNVRNVNINLNEIEYRLDKLKKEIAQLPGTELRLLGIERTFNLNNQIYTFLLQKRFEAEIARASNTPDYEIVDSPRTFRLAPILPKKKINYIIALILALFFPTGFIILKDMFNTKITTEEQVELLDTPYIGHIILNPQKDNQIALNDPNSTISESFRNVQTNISFFLSDNQNKIITITSSVSGEGKSFCSLNLASSFALSGYRVVLLEFDLRRPSIHKFLNVEPLIGLSSYLSNQAMVMDIIMETSNPNLSFIPAGRIAPNPAQLISSAKTQELIDYLKEEYDYVFIDTAPVGIISETFNLLKHSDFRIIIAKANYTKKQALINTIKAFDNNKIDRTAVLLNGINPGKSSYKYKYTSNYYTKKKKRV
jgi:tyrosine-protein kinase Etk/Wzc